MLSTLVIILVVIFIGLPMVGTLLMTLIGIAIWMIKWIWGMLTDGFRGSAEGYQGSSSSQGPTVTGGGGATQMNMNLPPFFANIDDICKNTLSDDNALRQLEASLGKLETNISNCSADYSTYRQGAYIKNMCYMSSMFNNAIKPLLSTALTDKVGTDADKNVVRAITGAFCGNGLNFTNTSGDGYADIVNKFNSVDNAIVKSLEVIPSEYTYIIPEMPPYTTMTGIKSYKCNTYNGIEAGILSYLRKRTSGTPSSIQEIAEKVAVNLCKSKGWESGTGTYKGCSGCAGCCEPTTDALPPSGPITGANAVTGAGTVATTADSVGAAKCPPPKLREYRLNRKPAVFRKTKAPTNPFLECFDDMETIMGGRHMDMRESQRTQKGTKMYDFMRRVGL